MNYGFVKVASAIPAVNVGNCEYNRIHIENQILEAEDKGVSVVCFPELSLTAYTCQDLFQQQLLLEQTELELMQLLNFTRPLNVISIVGLPIVFQGTLLNCAAVISKGKLLGVVPKTYLPNYKEFYEMRWFTSGEGIKDSSIRLAGHTAPIGTNLLFKTDDFCFGVEICEDVWAPIPPSSSLALHGADIIFNLSADNDVIGKHSYLKNLISQQSARCISGYVFSGCGFGESTQDVVFSGKALVYENGTLLAEGKRFCLDEQLVVSDIDVERLHTERRTNTTFTASVKQQKDFGEFVTLSAQQDLMEKPFLLTRTVDAHPFVPEGPTLDERCKEILNIQMEGLAKRMVHTNCKRVVVGISGGLDSTLALLVCVRTFDLLKYDRRDIVGITMPGFGTTDRTYTNATNLMKFLGITIREIDIVAACKQHFDDLNIDSHEHDTTYENCQARERTQILMDVANQMGGIVVGTGDLSELALGWATYNGDHMSMYGVNSSVPKTLVRHLVVWTANHMEEGNCRTTLLDIADTPISPELIPADKDGQIAQKTEDLVGPYELHDFFLYNFLRFSFPPQKIFFLAQHAFGTKYSKTTLKKWLTTFCKRFFSQQFKRSCMPDGPKVGNCSLSPRGDWRMPSDADSALWLAQCDEIQN